jgi:hypothetical protein
MIDLVAAAKCVARELDGIADGKDDPAAIFSDFLAAAIKKVDPDDMIAAAEGPDHG